MRILKNDPTTKIYKVSELEPNTIPSNYAEPFYVVATSTREIRVEIRLEFLTKEDILRKNGDRKWFDDQYQNAEAFKDYTHAYIVADKFQRKNLNFGQEFFVIGSNQAYLIRLLNDMNNDSNF